MWPRGFCTTPKSEKRETKNCHRIIRGNLVCSKCCRMVDCVLYDFECPMALNANWIHFANLNDFTLRTIRETHVEYAAATTYQLARINVDGIDPENLLLTPFMVFAVFPCSVRQTWITYMQSKAKFLLTSWLHIASEEKCRSRLISRFPQTRIEIGNYLTCLRLEN